MNLNRRNFIKLSAATTANLSLGFSLTGCSEVEDPVNFSPNNWLSIYTDNKVIIKITRAEVGQGVISAIPRIIAEELNLDWHNIETQLAEANPKYGRMRTSGSLTIRDLWQPLRVAGASAREMLEKAAALTWNCNIDDVYSENGYCLNKKDGSKLSYGELTKLANTLDIPDSPSLKPFEDFSIVGKELRNPNIINQITGSNKYGIDTELPGLLYAAIKHSPNIGATVQKIVEPNDRPPKVTKILNLGSSVAVVAASYWQAKKYLDQLSVVWVDGRNRDLNQEKIESDFNQALKLPVGEAIDQIGETPFKLSSISADYTNAYQAHVPMEPMNCTVSIDESGCKVWVPTQHPIMALIAAKNTYYSKLGLLTSKILNKLGIPDKVEVYPTLCGGGFGRRLEQDFVIEAIKIAKELNYPVKLIWTREEDIKNDFYRPYSKHRLSATISGKEITNWKHHSVAGESGRVNGGAIHYSYDIPNRSLYFSKIDHGIPIGSWRSVSYSNHTFANECFIDEIAEKIGTKPIEFRIGLLKKNIRAQNAITKLKRLVYLHQSMNTSKTSIGYAYTKAFGSYIALAIELKSEANKIAILNIFCVLDCGIIIDPDTTRAQIEGGIVFGLNAATQHEVTIQNGSIEQSNFDDYPLIRINESPKIVTELTSSTEAPGGVGEIAVPVVAPALANAVYELTGLRQRSTPINLSKT